MLRRFVGSVAVLFLCVGLVAAADKNDTKTGKDTKDVKGKKGQKATITKVDRKNGTITVRMPGKDGKKEETRTFKLTEEVRMLDSTGRAVAIDVFQSGDEVLVFEAEGKLKEIHKHKGKTGAKEKSATDKKPGGSK